MNTNKTQPKPRKWTLRKFIITIAVSTLIVCSGLTALVNTYSPTDESEATAVSQQERTQAITFVEEDTGSNKPDPTATNWPTRTPRATATEKPTATLDPTSGPTSTATALPDEITALVVGITDGDTIDVEIEGVVYQLRYIGMDTPERGEPFFAESTEANRQLVADQTVTLVKDVSETDRFGRLLRYVYLADGTFVNAELVRSGYALAATYPPDVANAGLFAQLQNEAEANTVGLWAAAAAEEVAVVPTATTIRAATPTTVLQPTSTVAPQPTATQLEPPTAPPAPTPTQPPPPTEAPVAAPGNVQISFIFYDGIVSRVESDEYAVITNNGGSPVNLSGWRLNAGAPGQDFSFPGFDLQPGQSCRVYTNENHPESCGFSFNNGQAIWNNDGDCGYLFDNNNQQVSQYCY